MNMRASATMAERARLKRQKQREAECKAQGHIKVMFEERNNGGRDCFCLHCGKKWTVPANEADQVS